MEKLWLVLEDILSPPSDATDTLHGALALMTSVAITSNASKRFKGPMRHIILNYVKKYHLNVAIEPM